MRLTAKLAFAVAWGWGTHAGQGSGSPLRNVCSGLSTHKDAERECGVPNQRRHPVAHEIALKPSCFNNSFYRKKMQT